MRREFILTLLGIICMSTISSLFNGLPEREPNKLLLDAVTGSVGAGNFSYWQLGYAGPLVIELRSLTGDADLYIADHMRPSYEVDQNEFSSATCGLDSVFIPETYHRPIGIAVFGHWSHEVSDYKLYFYLDTSSVKMSEEMKAIERGQRHEKPERETKNVKTDHRRTDEEKPRFVKFLNILDMIFDIVFL